MTLKDDLQEGNFSSLNWSGVIHIGRDDTISLKGLGDLTGVTFDCSVRQEKYSEVGLIEPTVQIVDEIQGIIR